MANEVKLFGYYTMGNKQVWVADIANDQVFFENCDERPNSAFSQWTTFLSALSSITSQQKPNPPTQPSPELHTEKRMI